MNALWPTQERGLEHIRGAVDAGHRNICVTSPTGGGKSRMMFERLHAWTRSSLYTDRRMLFSQIAEGLDGEGFEYGKRAAGIEPALLRDVQLSMVQTETSQVLKKGRDIHPSQQVLIDEAHKNAGDSMQELLKRHRESDSDAIVIGFTATPLGIGHAYDFLIQAGTVSDLRRQGSLVMAHHFGPDEPDTNWVGKVKIDDGQCGIDTGKRMEFAHRVFGRVVDNYREINPEQRPTVLFAPGVKESLWFAEHLTEQGIPAAHIDGTNCWMDGEYFDSDQDIRDEIRERLREGSIKVVCNRFVLREGIDWPFVSHGIFATVFGSLTSYIQAGGRFLRVSRETEKPIATIQDHGGNWWRHGSLNADREWTLEDNDRTMAGMRAEKIREKKEQEPIVCPKCHAVRLWGKACHACGYEHRGKSRPVLQSDGTLKEQRGDIYRQRRYVEPVQAVKDQWRSRVMAIRNSKKATVKNMTFSQLNVMFARDNNWRYAPPEIPFMPEEKRDWFRPIREVPLERLKGIG